MGTPVPNGYPDETIHTRVGGTSAILPIRNTHSSHGYFVNLEALVVTFGTTFGEQLVSADDLLPGDIIRLKQGNSPVSVSVDTPSKGAKEIHFLNLSLGRGMMLAHTSRSLILMSEFGQVIHACVLDGSKNMIGSLFMLFYLRPEQAIDYTLIDVADQ